MSIDGPTLHDRVEASSPSRIHMGLTVDGNVISQPKLGERLFGGAGAAVDYARTMVKAERIEGDT